MFLICKINWRLDFGYSFLDFALISLWSVASTIEIWNFLRKIGDFLFFIIILLCSIEEYRGWLIICMSFKGVILRFRRTRLFLYAIFMQVLDLMPRIYLFYDLFGGWEDGGERLVIRSWIFFFLIYLFLLLF